MVFLRFAESLGEVFFAESDANPVYPEREEAQQKPEPLRRLRQRQEFSATFFCFVIITPPWSLSIRSAGGQPHDRFNENCPFQKTPHADYTPIEAFHR